MTRGVWARSAWVAGLIDGSSFLATVFLDSNLDDIAPLTGPGSTETVKLYERAPVALFGVGLAVLGLARRRRASFA